MELAVMSDEGRALLVELLSHEAHIAHRNRERLEEKGASAESIEAQRQRYGILEACHNTFRGQFSAACEMSGVEANGRGKAAGAMQLQCA